METKEITRQVINFEGEPIDITHVVTDFQKWAESSIKDGRLSRYRIHKTKVFRLKTYHLEWNDMVGTAVATLIKRRLATVLGRYCMATFAISRVKQCSFRVEMVFDPIELGLWNGDWDSLFEFVDM